jgi:ribosome-associated heat shock protein Hsp15
VRIDKWLWAARFFKTRSLATDAVAAGHVRVGGTRVKPAKEVRVGDTVEVRRDTFTWTVLVLGLSERRGPASEAAGLYEETKESQETREQHRAELRLSHPTGTRPTKQDRRRLDALRKRQRRR